MGLISFFKKAGNVDTSELVAKTLGPILRALGLFDACSYGPQIELKPDEEVYFKHGEKWRKGKVRSVHEDGKSVHVENHDGETHHIRRFNVLRSFVNQVLKLY